MYRNRIQTQREETIMNKTLSGLTITFFSIALMTAAGVALAGPGPDHFRDGPPHHGRGMPGMPVVDMVMRAVMRLDLSDEQVDSITAIMKSLKADDRELMKDMRANHEQLKELIKADTFDETAVAEIAGNEGTLTTERLILASRAMSQVFAQLTDEQRAELEAMAEQRAARRAEKRREWLEDDV